MSNKAIVSERAVIARINRALAGNWEALRVNRPGTKWESELGRYYLVDLSLNTINAQHVDLAELAAELEVLKGYEELDESD